MAKGKRIVRVKAKINLKYDKDIIKIGKEFKIRLEDAQYMVERGYIDLLEELPKEDPQEGETPKDGE